MMMTPVHVRNFRTARQELPPSRENPAHDGHKEEPGNRYPEHPEIMPTR
jgi:hypothetical protein